MPCRLDLPARFLTKPASPTAQVPTRLSGTTTQPAASLHYPRRTDTPRQARPVLTQLTTHHESPRPIPTLHASAFLSSSDSTPLPRPLSPRPHRLPCSLRSGLLLTLPTNRSMPHRPSRQANPT